MASTLQRRIERERGQSIEEIMRELYVDKKMTMEQISKELDINIRSCQRWLKECGIPARKMTWA